MVEVGDAYERVKLKIILHINKLDNDTHSLENFDVFICYLESPEGKKFAEFTKKLLSTLFHLNSFVAHEPRNTYSYEFDELTTAMRAELLSLGVSFVSLGVNGEIKGIGTLAGASNFESFSTCSSTWATTFDWNSGVEIGVVSMS